MRLRNGLGCCGVSEEDTNLVSKFGIVRYWVLDWDAAEKWVGMLWSIGGRHQFNNWIRFGMLLSIGLGCCCVCGWDAVECRREDTNLMNEFGMVRCWVLDWDAVEYWFGMLLGTGFGCCWVSSGRDQYNNRIRYGTLLSIGLGCCWVPVWEAVEYWIVMLSVGGKTPI